ncbi:hypothetical protein GCM10025867_43250 [Frondihabitans sucicola]|uniref:Alginate lyase domain-containing protein n=1 Tax=Frondihabitans sucicola TaxID=1268041 RepID=A0ABN6Y454_9MICO|nr:hypothetical protein [Frondihabitans sucicola]BDZ52084.1 hypothetical protein GCM10025867_43250 [Frondihabitans sucicola]
MKMSTRLITALGLSSVLCLGLITAPAYATAGTGSRAVTAAAADAGRHGGGGHSTVTGAVAPPTRATAAAVAHDGTAQAYYQALLRHTRWAETQYDPAKGIYKLADQNFAVVLGNAVLLTRGDYDAKAAGIDKATLRQHTLATIAHYAASNRLAGGTEWGKTLFWDSTFESYFTLAAHLLWTELDQQTRDDVDAITSGQAAYNTGLGTADDPASGSWTPNGLTGGSRGDTKLEEMGVYAQGIAPGIAWAGKDDPSDAWRTAFGTWSRNESGLPAADQANPTKVDGVPVSDNTAGNLHDTFIVENHGSFGPHYQEELWRTSGRNSIQFLLSGTKMPEVLTEQPNGDELWKTILSVMSDAGEPLMPMVEDREHLYGRDVIPLAFLSQVQGDRYAATAENALAKRLAPYQAYAPADRLTKFSGRRSTNLRREPKSRSAICCTSGACRPVTRSRPRRPTSCTPRPAGQRITAATSASSTTRPRTPGPVR